MLQFSVYDSRVQKSFRGSQTGQGQNPEDEQLCCRKTKSNQPLLDKGKAAMGPQSFRGSTNINSGQPEKNGIKQEEEEKETPEEDRTSHCREFTLSLQTT